MALLMLFNNNLQHLHKEQKNKRTAHIKIHCKGLCTVLSQHRLPGPIKPAYD